MSGFDCVQFSGPVWDKVQSDSGFSPVEPKFESQVQSPLSPIKPRLGSDPGLLSRLGPERKVPPHRVSDSAWSSPGLNPVYHDVCLGSVRVQVLGPNAESSLGLSGSISSPVSRVQHFDLQTLFQSEFMLILGPESGFGVLGSRVCLPAPSLCLIWSPTGSWFKFWRNSVLCPWSLVTAFPVTTIPFSGSMSKLLCGFGLGLRLGIECRLESKSGSEFGLQCTTLSGDRVPDLDLALRLECRSWVP
uniref:Uncharacterized protein n=1 Tax=Cannabis sativa TaxID=3483 RepID=A0A803QRU2_CANSA